MFLVSVTGEFKRILLFPRRADIGRRLDWFESELLQTNGAATATSMVSFENSQGQAVLALKELGWLDWQPQRVDAASFRELFPLIESPRPLQTLCAEEALQLDGPGLVLGVELPMGEGKTGVRAVSGRSLDNTAACKRCSRSRRALPTQATSNQMFGRVCRFLEQRYPGQTVNTHLLHGQAWLSDERPTRCGIEPTRPASSLLFPTSAMIRKGGWLRCRTGLRRTRSKDCSHRLPSARLTNL